MGDRFGVLIYSDVHDIALEMIGRARELADKLQTKLGAIVIGKNIQQKANELSERGADTVFVADNAAFEHFQPESYVVILEDLVRQCETEILLIGSTRNSKPLAARLASRLGAGCVPDCIGLSLDAENKLVGERITYGGNALAKVVFKVKPQIATVPARAFEKVEARGQNGSTVSIEAKIEPARSEVVDRKPLEASNVRIEDAETIVSCGRGLEKKEDMALLNDLAKVICGQVGCSRPLAEDRKWFTEWVGLSGHKVKPKLYIACGISGVIQHVAGIRDAKVIVAINKDEQAPIFEAADYAVVGNLYEVLPALKEALQKQLK